jgi:hypothetical protein
MWSSIEWLIEGVPCLDFGVMHQGQHLLHCLWRLYACVKYMNRIDNVPVPSPLSCRIAYRIWATVADAFPAGLPTNWTGSSGRKGYWVKEREVAGDDNVVRCRRMPYCCLAAAVGNATAAPMHFDRKQVPAAHIPGRYGQGRSVEIQ